METAPKVVLVSPLQKPAEGHDGQNGLGFAKRKIKILPVQRKRWSLYSKISEVAEVVTKWHHVKHGMNPGKKLYWKEISSFYLSSLSLFSTCNVPFPFLSAHRHEREWWRNVGFMCPISGKQDEVPVVCLHCYFLW